MKKFYAILFILALTVNVNAQDYIKDFTRINSVDSKDQQRNICISPNKKYMAIATTSAIKIIDVQNFKIIKLLPVAFDNINAISFLATNDKILVVGNSKEVASAEIYLWSEKTLVKQVNPIGSGTIDYNRQVATISANYLVCADKNKNINVLNCNTLDPVRTFPVASKNSYVYNPTINSDESLIAITVTNGMGNNANLLVYDIYGIQKYSHQFGKENGGDRSLEFTNQNELVITFIKMNFSLGYAPDKTSIYKVDLNTQKITTILVSTSLPSFAKICRTGNFVSFIGDIVTEDISDQSYFFNVLCLEDSKINEIHASNRFRFIAGLGRGGAFTGGNSSILEISEDKFIVPADYDNFNYIVDFKKRELIGFLYHKDNSIAFVSSDGRFTGDNEAISNLQYKISKMPDIKLASQISQLYTPRLFNQLMNPSSIPEANVAELTKMIKLAPELKITSPDSLSTQKNNSVKVSYTVKDNGDGVKEIKFFVNGKLLTDDTRGFKAKGENSRDILLVSGDNVIEAVAVSNSGYQSSPTGIMAKYNGAKTTTNLYILGIGINQYKNSKYNLNYAVTDATALIDYVKLNGIGIFKSIDAKVLTDQMATKINIIAELNRISQQINETDVFILYYAGHGVMNEGSADTPKDYFLALADVHQMFGNDLLLSEKGISAGELREWCKNIKAQKQVILLDACQSGGATETFAMRGASEEKAIIQLAQSTGVFLISSSGEEQVASEFDLLKHGVFTYALLEGLKGDADGGTKDGKITIKEIEAYLNDRIPELTQQYKGSTQFPNTWSKGMDFPIVIAK